MFQVHCLLHSNNWFMMINIYILDRCFMACLVLKCIRGLPSQSFMLIRHIGIQAC